MQYQQVSQKTVKQKALDRHINEGQTDGKYLICAKMECSSKDIHVMFA